MHPSSNYKVRPKLKISNLPNGNLCGLFFETQCIEADVFLKPSYI